MFVRNIVRTFQTRPVPTIVDYLVDCFVTAVAMWTKPDAATESIVWHLFAPLSCRLHWHVAVLARASDIDAAVVAAVAVPETDAAHRGAPVAPVAVIAVRFAVDLAVADAVVVRPIAG